MALYRPYVRYSKTKCFGRCGTKIIDPSDWLRILYMHPDHIHDEMLNALGKIKNFVPYFDIPFQSGSDRVLKLMNRKNESKENMSTHKG